MRTPKRAEEIYIEVLTANKISIDPDIAVEWVKNNWWWISIVGEKIFRFLVKLFSKKKKNIK